jgi:hypothetical protein
MRAPRRETVFHIRNMAPTCMDGQAQDRLTAQGARYKEEQSMPYDVQPCTLYLGPCTVCGAVQ